MKKPSLLNTIMTVGIAVVIGAATYEYRKMVDADKEFDKCLHDNEMVRGDDHVQ